MSEIATPTAAVTTLPPPRLVSEKAAEYLRAQAQAYVPADPAAAAARFPSRENTGEWLSFVEAMDSAVRPMFESQVPPSDRLAVSSRDIDGVEAFVLTPAGVETSRDTPLFLELHGGALALCGGDLGWMMVSAMAVGRRGSTWVPDYRMPPLHPYPAALDDALTVYRAALDQRDPGRLIVGGVSAGANIAAALMFRLKEEGLPLPRALVLQSPELDLTESGDSFAMCNAIGFPAMLDPVSRLYAGEQADLADPHLSPLFGDVTGFPPTYLSAGTRDIFLSNVAEFQRKLVAAGVDCELQLFEAMPHGGFGGHAPEDHDFRARALRFENAWLDLD